MLTFFNGHFDLGDGTCPWISTTKLQLNPLFSLQKLEMSIHIFNNSTSQLDEKEKEKKP